MDLPSVDEISSEENLLVMGTGDSSADEVLRQVQDCDAETFTSTVSVDKNQLGRAMRNITIGPYPRDSQDQSLSKYHHPAFIQEARRAGLLSDPEANFCFCSALGILTPMRWVDCTDKVRVARLMNEKSQEAIYKVPTDPFFRFVGMPTTDEGWTQMVKVLIREEYLRPPRCPTYILQLPEEVLEETLSNIEEGRIMVQCDLASRAFSMAVQEVLKKAKVGSLPILVLNMARLEIGVDMDVTEPPVQSAYPHEGC